MKATYSYIFNRKKLTTKKELSSLELRITLNRKSKYITTKIKLKNEQWDDHKKKVKKNHPNHTQINNALSQKLIDLNNFELDRQRYGISYNMDALTDFFKGENKGKTSGIFLKWCRDVNNNSPNISDSTRNQRKSFLNKLEKYDPNLTFPELNYEFMRKFATWMHTLTNKQTGKPLSQVTIHKNIKNLRRFLKMAYNEERIDKIPAFNVPLNYKEKEALTQNEVAQIEKLDLSGMPQIQYTKDIFLFGCYTAIRFGDIKVLAEDNFRENNMLHFVMRKVKRPINIPLAKLFEGKGLEIFNKYRRINNDKDTIFDNPINQVVNRNLKVIQAIAGIKKPLHFHIARHTCLTLLGKKTGNPYLVMKIAGHKDMRTAMRYTRGAVDDELFELL